MRAYWVSAPYATGEVQVSAAGRIVEAPPVWRVFIGQPLANLKRWLESKGGPVWVERMEESKSGEQA